MGWNGAAALVLLVLVYTGGLEAENIVEVMNGTAREQFEEHHVPGGVVVMIQNGSVVLSRGYGLADIRNQKSVNEETVFRVGSLSKILTAAAVLKLNDEGNMDLKADLRPMLPADVAKSFGSPVTAMDLLTHTSGLDNSDIGDAARDADSLRSLKEQLEFRMPKAVDPPGQLFRYSNYNYVIAGLLIERETGQPYPDAMRNFLQELQMSHSTFHPALSGDQKGRLARSYSYFNKNYEELPLDYSQMPPADGLFTTAEDMGKLLVALLGRDAGISPAVRSAMFQQQYSFHPLLDGIAVPFFVESRKGFRAFTYTGGQLGFTSQVVIVPDLQAALFVAYNRRTSTPRRELTNVFLASLETGKEESPPHSDFQTANAHEFEGTYRYTGGTQTTIEKVWYLLGFYGDIRIRAMGSDLISSGERYRPVAPFVFCAGERNCGAFRTVAGDLYLATGVESYRRLPWYERTLLHQAALILCLVGFLSAVLRTRKRWIGAGISFQTRMAISTLRLASLILLFFAIAFSLFLKGKGADLDYGMPVYSRILLWLPLATLPLSGFSLVSLPVIWKDSCSRSCRVHFSVLVLAHAIFTMLLFYWNLAG